MVDTESCEGCGTIIECDPMNRLPTPLEFIIQTDTRELDRMSYILCQSCKQKIVNFVEDGEFVQDSVELKSPEKVAHSLRKDAKRFEQLADAIEDSHSL